MTTAAIFEALNFRSILEKPAYTESVSNARVSVFTNKN